MTLHFDVWARATPNGTALGELTAAYDKEFRAVHQAIGSGQFTINRHDAQYAWCATDNLVRVRRVTGGPFAYDDSRYIGAFWIESGDDTVISPDEEGGEEVTRGGRTAEACLRWAIIYPDAFDSRNDRFTTKTRIDGNWHIPDKTAGEVLAIFLRDVDERVPNPLPFVTKDFGQIVDSTGATWSDADTKWSFPVGTNLLDALGTCVSGDLYYRVGADFEFHAYEDEPGTDLSATITFAKGVNIAEAAERQIHARAAVSRTLVQGTKENGKLKYYEVNPANSPISDTVETAIGRREGFVEFKRTPTTAKLRRAGRRYIRRQKQRHDGPTTTQVLEIWPTDDEPGFDSAIAFEDYEPGDVVTVNIPGEWDNLARRVYAIVLTEREAGDDDVTIEFEQSPFDPAKGDGGEFGDGTDGGTRNCGDCPPVPPHVPGDFVPQCVDLTGSYTPQPAGTYPALLADAPTSPVGYLLYLRPGGTHPKVPAPGHVGNWGFPVFNSGGADYAGDGTESFVRVITAGPGTLTIHTKQYAPSPSSATLSVAVRHDDGGHVVDSSVSGIAIGTNITVTIPDDGFCYHYTDVGDSGATGGKWGTTGYTWTPTSVSDPPLEGQQHVEEFTGDGATTAYQTAYPYAPGSLLVTVDGVVVVPTETDPETGTFTLASAPANGALIVVHYQNAGTTPTGGGGTVPTPDSPSPGVTDHGALSGLGDDDHPQYTTAAEAAALIAAQGLGDHADVDLTTPPTDGQALVWDDGTSTWIPGDASGGGEDTSYVEVAATGATETLDCSAARTYDLTFDQSCTLTLTGAVNDETHYLTVLIRQSGAGGYTITWPGSVTWMGTPVTTTTSDVQIVNLLTVDGGTNWIATAGATATLVADLDDLTDVTITTPAEGHEIRYRSGVWVNETPSSSTTRWEVVMTGSETTLEPVTNDAETDWLYAEV